MVAVLFSLTILCLKTVVRGCMQLLYVECDPRKHYAEKLHRYCASRISCLHSAIRFNVPRYASFKGDFRVVLFTKACTSRMESDTNVVATMVMICFDCLSRI